MNFRWLVTALLLLPLSAGRNPWQGAQGLPKDVVEAASALEMERAAAKREGLPLVNADLYPHRPVPANLNAAKPYAEAFRAIDASPAAKTVSRLQSDYLAGKLDAAGNKQVEDAIRTLQPVFERIRAASKRPYWDTGRNFDQGASILFPEYARLKNLARLLSVSAEAKARKGAFIKAFDELACGIRVARHGGQDPTLIALLVRVAAESIVLGEAQRIIKANPNSRDAQQLCLDLLRQYPGIPILKTYLGGELVMGRAAILVDIKTLKDVSVLAGDAEADSSRFTGDATVWKRAWESRLIQFYRSAIKALPKDPEDTLSTSRALKPLGDAEEQHERNRELSHLLNAILIPVLNQTAASLGRLQASQRLTELYAKLLLFRQAHGAFPASLTSLGKVLIDPLDSKPIRYRKTAQGFLIYSVDRDGKDDGGLTRKSGASANQGSWDYVLEFP